MEIGRAEDGRRKMRDENEFHNIWGYWEGSHMQQGPRTLCRENIEKGAKIKDETASLMIFGRKHLMLVHDTPRQTKALV